MISFEEFFLLEAQPKWVGAGGSQSNWPKQHPAYPMWEIPPELESKRFYGQIGAVSIGELDILIRDGFMATKSGGDNPLRGVARFATFVTTDLNKLYSDKSNVIYGDPPATASEKGNGEGRLSTFQILFEINIDVGVNMEHAGRRFVKGESLAEELTEIEEEGDTPYTIQVPWIGKNPHTGQQFKLWGIRHGDQLYKLDKNNRMENIKEFNRMRDREMVFAKQHQGGPRATHMHQGSQTQSQQAARYLADNPDDVEDYMMNQTARDKIYQQQRKINPSYWDKANARING